MPNDAMAARDFFPDHRPHRLAHDNAGDLWEFISYPWVEGKEDILVNIRIPGDPTSLRTVDASAVIPEHKDCLCLTDGDFYMGREYYLAREAKRKGIEEDERMDRLEIEDQESYHQKEEE